MLCPFGRPCTNKFTVVSTSEVAAPAPATSSP